MSANHKIVITLPNVEWPVAEIIAEAVASAGGDGQVELLPAAIGDGAEVRAWVRADSVTAAATNWAGIITGILRDCGHLFPLYARENTTPRVKVAGVTRRAHDARPPVSLLEGRAGIISWRKTYNI
jgi:hypothetical protein